MSHSLNSLPWRLNELALFSGMAICLSKKLTKLAPDRADEIGELLDLQQQREAAQ